MAELETVCPCLGAVMILWVAMAFSQSHVRGVTGRTYILLSIDFVRTDKYDWFLLASRAILGLFWCLMGLTDLTYNPPTMKIINPDSDHMKIFISPDKNDPLTNWLETNWILPALAISLCMHILYAAFTLGICEILKRCQHTILFLLAVNATSSAQAASQTELLNAFTWCENAQPKTRARCVFLATRDFKIKDRTQWEMRKSCSHQSK